jgi:hypothetical protein
MWIARDKNNRLHIFSAKPSRIFNYWQGLDRTSIPCFLFSEIKWEDEEPRELVLK